MHMVTQTKVLASVATKEGAYSGLKQAQAFIVMLVIWWCLYKTLLTLFS